ncbi:hypothetical protein MMC07_005544 [Pseudocyphellaria aurata]|nr:hypothetical protein [Pseudocyphellaria aurata]
MSGLGSSQRMEVDKESTAKDTAIQAGVDGVFAIDPKEKDTGPTATNAGQAAVDGAFAIDSSSSRPVAFAVPEPVFYLPFDKEVKPREPTPEEAARISGRPRWLPKRAGVTGAAPGPPKGSFTFTPQPPPPAAPLPPAPESTSLAPAGAPKPASIFTGLLEPVTPPAPFAFAPSAPFSFAPSAPFSFASPAGNPETPRIFTGLPDPRVVGPSSSFAGIPPASVPALKWPEPKAEVLFAAPSHARPLTAEEEKGLTNLNHAQRRNLIERFRSEIEAEARPAHRAAYRDELMAEVQTTLDRQMAAERAGWEKERAELKAQADAAATDAAAKSARLEKRGIAKEAKRLQEVVSGLERDLEASEAKLGLHSRVAQETIRSLQDREAEQSRALQGVKDTLALQTKESSRLASVEKGLRASSREAERAVEASKRREGELRASLREAERAVEASKRREEEIQRREEDSKRREEEVRASSANEAEGERERKRLQEDVNRLLRDLERTDAQLEGEVNTSREAKETIRSLEERGVELGRLNRELEANLARQTDECSRRDLVEEELRASSEAAELAVEAGKRREEEAREAEAAREAAAKEKIARDVAASSEAEKGEREMDAPLGATKEAVEDLLRPQIPRGQNFLFWLLFVLLVLLFGVFAAAFGAWRERQLWMVGEEGFWGAAFSLHSGAAAASRDPLLIISQMMYSG